MKGWVCPDAHRSTPTARRQRVSSAVEAAAVASRERATGTSSLESR